MSAFSEDEDFIAVRRPKRKLIPNEIPIETPNQIPIAASGVSDDPNFLVPQVKKRKVEEKASDVDIVDRSILKNIRVPKKVVETNDYLQRISLQSKDFVREIREVILRSQKNKDLDPFDIRTSYLIENRELQRKFKAKRLSMKNDGLKTDSYSDNYGFCFYKEFAAVRELAKNGVKVGNVKRSLLGAPGCGVTLSLHADHLCGQESLYGWLIICKFLRGRPNFVPVDENPLDPQPGYECHLPQKSSLDGKIHSINDLSQVYLYEYSEDFDLMDFPSHVLPTAAIQIAAFSVFKTIVKNVKNGKTRRSFASVPPLMPKLPAKPSVPPPNLRLPEEPCGDSGDAPKKPAVDPGPVRVAVSSAGTRHSSGGIILGTCLIQVPLANSLTAEAHIVSFASCMAHVPFGSAISSLTLDRFINLEDLYTTVFKDGAVKLSLSSEIFVNDVGFFNYLRIFLKDSCTTKRQMMNFASYLRTTKKACVLSSHLNCFLILFPDSQLAHDFGLPKPDPLAQPHFLNLVLLSVLPRNHFYQPFIAHKPNEVEENNTTLSSIWRSSSSTSLVHRFLRFSFAQQGEAQRLYLRHQAEKASSKATASKFPKPKTIFSYKPVTTALDEAKVSHRSSKVQKPTTPQPSQQPSSKTSPPNQPPSSGSVGRVSDGDVEKDDDDDDDDILAVLDTIDKVDLDETSPKKTKPKKPAAGQSAKPVKEVFHDPPASPNSAERTKKSEKVPVVELPAVVRKESVKPEVSPKPQDFQQTLMNSVQGLKTIMSNLKAQISTQNGAEASPVRGTAEDSGIGATPTPETTPKKSDTDSQSVMKSSKDWYWFYMKNQTKESENSDEVSSKTPEPLNETPEKKAASPPPRKTRLLPTPPKRQPLLQSDSTKSYVASPLLHQDSKSYHVPQKPRDSNSYSVPPLMQCSQKAFTPTTARETKPYSAPQASRVTSYSYRQPEPAASLEFDRRSREWPRSSVPPANPHHRPPLLATRPSLLPRSSAAPYANANGPQRPSLLSRSGGALLQDPPLPRRGSSVYNPPNERLNSVCPASKDVDLRELPAPSFDEPNNFITSKYDVDMRVPPAHFSRPSVFEPQRRIGPERSESMRPVKRISTYEPGRGFQ